MTTMISTTFQVPSHHPCFEGHFPGNPIVPGALLLQWLIEALEQQMAGREVIAVDSIKFSASLKPADHCEIQCDYVPDSCKVKLSCRVGSISICKAVIVLAELE